MPEGTTVAPWPSGRAAFLHGAHSAASATPVSVKLIWPVPAGHNLITFYDPDWTGGGDDTYPGHHGLDIGFHCGSQGCDWNDMVNNPTDIYACAGGTVIWTEDSYDDQCAVGDPPGSAHAPGGNLCQDICGYSCQMPTGPTGDNQQDCEAAGGTWTGSPCVNSVVIDHGPNTGLPYRYTGYYHIAKNSIPTALKTANAPVAKGDRIAYIGSSGSSSGPHIHFEVGPDIITLGGGEPTIDASASVDPFLSIWGGSNTTESLWEDQCSLPIYNTNTPSGNTPPLLTNCTARLLNKEISDIIHGNKTKDREFDIVKQLKKSGHDSRCGSNAISLKQYEDNPEAAQKFNKITKDAFENGSYTAVKTEGDGVSYLGPQASTHEPEICLGIIFHQLIGSVTPSHIAGPIDEAYCKQLISQMNKSLAGLDRYPTWSSVVGDSKIRLKFEKLNIFIDDRVFCPSFLDCGDGSDPSETEILLVAPREDPEHFVNIWVATLGGGPSGFATVGGLGSLPDDYLCVLNIVNQLPFLYEGNLIDFPDGVTASNSNTFQHELGHLFGLEHIWGNTAAEIFGGTGHTCDDDDGIADTPVQLGPGQGTDGEQIGPCNENTNTCPGGERDMYENAMGYSVSMCDMAEWSLADPQTYESTSILTMGQGDRMRASILSSPYIDTLNSEECLTTPPPPTGCHPCNDCGGATSPVGTTSLPDASVKLSWPTEAAGIVGKILYFDPNWYGNQNDTYSGHKGVDVSFYGGGYDGLEIPQSVWDEMDAYSISVFAAAPGTVVAVYDGFEDQCDTAAPAGSIHAPGGARCDSIYPSKHNHVIIDHGTTNAGYQYTSYLHLRKNSAVVSVGDAVTRGQKIGEIGSSGNSGWPHLHFGVGNSYGGILAPTDLMILDEMESFNTTPSLGLWQDQCALPIYNLPGETSPAPPACAARLLNPIGTTSPPADKWHLYKEWTPDA